MLKNNLEKISQKKIFHSHPLKNFQIIQRKKKIIYFLGCFLIIIAFSSSLLIIVAIYFQNWENQLTIKISERLPLPVLIVGKNIVWLNDYYKELSAVRNFYQKQYPAYSITDNQIKYQVLYKLIEQKIIEEAIAKYQITIDESELQKEIKTIEQTSPTQDLNQLTLEIFGWNFDEFIKRVVKISILTEKLNKFFINQKDFQAVSWNKINNLYNQLIAGEAFIKFGVNIGWFRENELAQNIFKNIENLSVGQITQIIETDLGYYIFQLENKIVLEDQQIGYQLNQIFVKKYDLNDYLQEQLQKIKIYRFINI